MPHCNEEVQGIISRRGTKVSTKEKVVSFFGTGGRSNHFTHDSGIVTWRTYMTRNISTMIDIATRKLETTLAIKFSVLYMVFVDSRDSLAASQ